MITLIVKLPRYSVHSDIYCVRSNIPHIKSYPCRPAPLPTQPLSAAGPAALLEGAADLVPQVLARRQRLSEHPAEAAAALHAALPHDRRLNK